MSNAPDTHTADDLRRINHIGPVYERRLRDAGIETYAQLAAQTPKRLAEILRDQAGISIQRIEEWDWIGQAEALGSHGSLQVGREVEDDDLHYGTFTIKLLINNQNNVRGTRVEYIQGKDQDAWGGWNEARLLNFIKHSAHLVSEETGPEPAPARKPEPKQAVSTPAEKELTDGKDVPETATVSVGIEVPHQTIRFGQPYTVRLRLGFTDLENRGDRSADYAASIYAKNMNGGAYEVVAEGGEMRHFLDPPTLLVEGQPLPKGTYRLSAIVKVSPDDDSPESVAYSEGTILEVR